MSLLDPRFKKLFLFFVEKAKRKFHFRLRDFCIMGNHIHLSIKPGKGGNLSKIMQWITENPVKAGLVERAAEWVFGSLYHRLHRLTSLVDDAVAEVFG
jgi:hypothetical protein